MASKTKGYQSDWDPMKADFDDTTYDAQYPDDDSSAGVNLDQCRLYVTNIPRTLSENGLRAAFSKFGTLVEAHVSNDPQKRYGLVGYQTPGEAKLALMTLNGLEPMRLSISIAHKKKPVNNKRPNPKHGQERREWHNGSSARQSKDRNSSYRDDNSIGSRGKSVRMQDSLSNQENEDDLLNDNDILLDAEDQELSLKLEELKLEYQKIDCKQRMLQLRQAEKKITVGTNNNTTNRYILPSGKVVFANDRAKEPSRNSASPTIGAGDSLNIPGLQRQWSRACVVCGAHADTCCAGCKLTPYCGPLCQRRDWQERHRSVCHNLARTVNEGVTDDTPPVATVIPPAAPMRRPRSPNRSHDQLDNGINIIAKKSPQNYIQPANNRSGGKPNGNQNNIGRRNDARPNFNKQDVANKTNHGRFNKNNTSVTDDKDEDWGATETKPAQKPAIEIPIQPKTEATTPKPVEQKVVKPFEQKVVKPVEQKVVQPVDEKPAVKPPAKVNDVLPTKKIVPKDCVIDLLSLSDAPTLSVESCYKGQFVCLCLPDEHTDTYMRLCEDYPAACEQDNTPYTPAIGSTFSYKSPTDGAWYRARLLSPTQAALLDAADTAPLSSRSLPGAARALPTGYDVLPEFSCLLTAPDVKVGDQLKCTLKTKTPSGFAVSLVNIQTGATAGDGEITRWLPEVAYPTPTAVIPEVQRPPVTHNSSVYLVECSSLDAVFVRPADKAESELYDGVVFDVASHGLTATPLKVPPTPGDEVLAQFSDETYYRALCRRTNVAKNKYMVEYIDFGNTEVCTLQQLAACPPALRCPRRPPHVARVSLASALTPAVALSSVAKEYIDKLKDEHTPLTLLLPAGMDSAPSGSAATLLISQSRVNLNNKLTKMSTPEWKKMEEKGIDVVQTPSLMFSSLKYLPLPLGGGALDVLELSGLPHGNISVCVAGSSVAKEVFTSLTDKMAEYCSSEIGREPYLPKCEELCIAKCEPYPQWFRAVVCGASAPGSPQLSVCFIDYGNMQDVPVHHVRKMLPEFLHLPAVASHIDIKGFPANPTEQQLARAVEYLNVDEEGRGSLTVTRCTLQAEGFYEADAPGLIQAMGV